MDDDSEQFLANVVEVDRDAEESDEVVGSINSTTNAKAKEEEKLREKLKFFYMNPIEKWQYKQRFPYKFLVQLIKIIVVTMQSCLFAHHRSFYVNFLCDNRVAFSHLFLQGWDPSREIMSYPPQSGDLAVYKTDDFFSSIDFAVVSYANLENAMGSYAYTGKENEIPPMEFCIDHFKVCDINAFNESYVFNSHTVRNCVNILITKEEAGNFSSRDYFRERNASIQFSSLIEARLTFGVKTVNLRTAGPRALPECYLFNLSIVFDNRAHSGKLKLSLDTNLQRLNCNGKIDYESDTEMESIVHSLLNSVVIIFCVISLILCSRAVYRAQILRRKVVSFFRENYRKELNTTDKLEFVNTWYLTMILSDIIIIIGSGLKEKIENNHFSGDEWNICSVMLGTGTFLIWFCVLRYLGFFETYNVVVLTMKIAAPMIFRFMVCTMLIYAGFTFCGWLVLGPYHTKFRSLSVTSECLFALINGDDVFGTFATLEPTKSALMWWFCRIYLYVFVSLFIYVVLSLFVSVILDAYETIKRYYVEGFPKNCIKEFVDSGFGGNLFSESSSSLADDTQCCSFCQRLTRFFSAPFSYKVRNGRKQSDML